MLVFCQGDPQLFTETCEGAEVLGTLVVNRGADWAEAEYAVHIQFDHERVATQLHE